MVQQFELVVGLYNYTIPLFVVYFAEDGIQLGTWMAMALGDQVHDVTACNCFHEYLNWLYQAGVFFELQQWHLVFGQFAHLVAHAGPASGQFDHFFHDCCTISNVLQTI